jgi:hypothetical protein
MKTLREKIEEILDCNCEDCKTMLSELTALFDTTVRGVIGEKELDNGHHESVVADDYSAWTRNALRKEQLSQWEKEKSE